MEVHFLRLFHNQLGILQDVFREDLFSEDTPVIGSFSVAFSHQFEVKAARLPSRHANAIGGLDAKHQLLGVDLHDIIVATLD